MSSSYQCTKKVIALTKLKKKHRKTYDYPLRKKLMVKGVEMKAGGALSSEIDAMLIKIQERQSALTAELEANKVRLEEAKKVRLEKAKKLRLEEAQTTGSKHRVPSYDEGYHFKSSNSQSTKCNTVDRTANDTSNFSNEAKQGRQSRHSGE